MAKNETKEATFTKEQLAGSKRFQRHADAIRAVLDNGKTYTIQQAQDALDKFFERKV